ncbi:hypothetical protein D3C81_1129560 [compost metagenome]
MANITYYGLPHFLKVAALGLEHPLLHVGVPMLSNAINESAYASNRDCATLLIALSILDQLT